MSKYRVKYASETKGELEIEAMPNGHLHNAARKLQAERDAGLPMSDHWLIVLECLETEIAERAKKAEEKPPDDTDHSFDDYPDTRDTPEHRREARS